MGRITKKRTKRARPARARMLAAVREKGTVQRRELLAVCSSSTIQRAVADGDLVKTRTGREVAYSEPVKAACRPADVVVGRTHDGRACEGVPGGRVHALATLLAGRKQTLGQRVRENLTLIGF